MTNSKPTTATPEPAGPTTVQLPFEPPPSLAGLSQAAEAEILAAVDKVRELSEAASEQAPAIAEDIRRHVGTAEAALRDLHRAQGKDNRDRDSTAS